LATKRHRFAQRRKSLGFTQEALADRLRVERSTVRRWESGESDPQPWARPAIAKVLNLSLDQLDALLHETMVSGAEHLVEHLGTAGPTARVQLRGIRVDRPDQGWPDRDLGLTIVHLGQPDLPEIDDMNRRELLRLFSMTGALLALPPLDTDRIVHAASTTAPRLDLATTDEYAQLNTSLWRVFTFAPSKAQVLPLVRKQLDVLTAKLGQPHEQEVHRRLCILAADLFQLAGEIFFDGNRYTDAAHCYTLAASAGEQAGAFDLWACALTRHAFVALYERQFAQAAPMLNLAATLAHRGDPTLSTRYWVASVQAETFAGLGDFTGCQQALDIAEQVQALPGVVHNGGWLRFDGSRLAEERGTCYVALRRPELAESALTDALAGTLTARRRASVMTDLAMIGAQRGDPDQVLVFAGAVVLAAQQTGSGVVSRKLRTLQPHLAPLLHNKQVSQLNESINALA
jgi:transcriptional regulator with XRE-family HTH domain